MNKRDIETFIKEIVINKNFKQVTFITLIF